MELMEKIKNAPLNPGCYLFKDETGRIIYVGKAKVLRNRVKQYFMEANQKDDKGFLLGKKIRDVEFKITETERDALIEEYYLIKYYKPWFNIQYKSDRKMTYYIEIKSSGNYSRFEVTSKRPDKTVEYLGCFRSEGRAREAISLLNRVYKTPICNRKFDNTVKQPCLHYELNHCMGPCGNKVDKQQYEIVMKEINRFFKGKQSKTLNRLKREMKEYITQMEYEKAAEVKNNFDQMKDLGRRIRHYITIPDNQDVVVFFRAFNEIGFSLFYIRSGAVIGRCDFNDGMSEIQLKVFLQSILKNKQPVRSDQPLADCLRNISADKLFVTLPVKPVLEAVCSLILKRYKDFS